MDASDRSGAPELTDSGAPTEAPPQRPGPSALAYVVGSWVLLTGVLVALGLALTAWAFDGPLGQWDDDAARWFADRRTPLADTLSAWGSRLAETFVIIGLTALVAGVLLVRRHWPDALLIVLAPTIEVTAFLVATFVVDRDRPPVARLDSAPPTSSFPSGHVAAAVAFYGALAVVAMHRTRHSWIRAAALILAVVAPMCVAWSRLYRGMHHPTDVIVGAAAGVVCVAVAVVAARIASTGTTSPPLAADAARTVRTSGALLQEVPR